VSYPPDKYGKTFLFNQFKGEKAMKKLLSIAFIMLSMIFVTTSVEAAPAKNSTNINSTIKLPKDNKIIVDAYTYTKTIWLYGRKYLNVYEVQFFQNGATKTQLINSINLSNRFHHRHRDFQSGGIWKNGRKYRVN
jgi:hypothetical protein